MCAQAQGTVCGANPWRVLDVPESADQKTIKRAYRKLALR